MSIISLEIRLGKNHFDVLEEAIQEPVGTQFSILDLGCGYNSPIYVYYRKYGTANIYSTGVDCYQPYIEISINKKLHNEYFKEDIRNLTGFKDRSYDYVMAVDLIEHLTKEEGYKLLSEMERIAKKGVIVSTPNGFVVNKANDTPWKLKMSDGTEMPDENMTMTHLSGWTVGEFRKLGYTVRGTIGSKHLFKYFTNNWDQKIINGFKTKYPNKAKLLMASQLITYNIPELAHQLVAYKRVI